MSIGATHRHVFEENKAIYPPMQTARPDIRGFQARIYMITIQSY